VELKKLSKIAVLGIFSFVLLLCVTQQSKAQTVYNNGSGTSNGYYYALYTSSGSATLTLGSTAGNYALSWSNAGDVVGGVGWNPGARGSSGTTSAPPMAITSFPSTDGRKIRWSSITSLSLASCTWRLQPTRAVFPAMGTTTARMNISRSTSLPSSAPQLSNSTWINGAGNRLERTAQSPSPTILTTGTVSG